MGTLRARGWVFTINNYHADQAQYIEKELLKDITNIEYIIVGKEVGEQGTPHLQGYVHFSNGVTGARMQNIFNPKKRWAGLWHKPAKGTGKQNLKYCTKDGTILLEHGEVPDGVGQKGGRIPKSGRNPEGLNAKMLEFQKDCKRGLSKAGLWEVHGGIMMRYASGTRDMITHYQSLAIRPPPIVMVAWGNTDTGKSGWIMESFGRDSNTSYWVTCSGTKIWWGDYNQQPVIVFDDFEPRNMDRQFFKLLFDKYAVRVEPKGGQVALTSRYMIISSNIDPATWYRDAVEFPNPADDVHYNAIQRRLGTVMHFTNAGATEAHKTKDPNWHCGFLPHVPVYVIPEITISVELPPEVETDTVVDSESQAATLVRRVAATYAAAETEDEPQLDPSTEVSESEEEGEKPAHRPRKLRKLSRLNRFVDDQAGCDDDDDDDASYYRVTTEDEDFVV